MRSEWRKLRILLLNENVRGTGSFYRSWHLARGLGQLGHEVVLITVSPNRRIVPQVQLEEGVNVLETPNLLDLVYGLGPGYGAVGIPYRILFAARHHFTIVHSFESRPNVILPSILSRTLHDSTLVVDWADWWGITSDGSGLQERRARPIPRIENMIEERVHGTADGVTAISTGLLGRAASIGVPAARMKCIPSGAPSDDIRPLDLHACRRELGIPFSHVLVGYVGSEIGDLGMVAPALCQVKKNHPLVKLAIIGPKTLPFALSRPSVRDAVIHFGRIPFDRLPTYLGACDMFLLPLRDTVFNRTRWPNKFGDYLAAGRPILCSDVSDVSAIVRAEECGLVWRDLGELIDGIGSLLEDEEASLRMARRARELAAGRLSWSELTRVFLEFYFKLTGAE